MPQNWTKPYVGFDEAAWGFFNVKKWLFTPCSWEETQGFAAELGGAWSPIPYPGWPWLSHPACVSTSTAVGLRRDGGHAAVYRGHHLDCVRDGERRMYLFPSLGSNKMDWGWLRTAARILWSCKLRSFLYEGRLSLCKLKLAETLVWQWACWNHSPLLPWDILIIK